MEQSGKWTRRAGMAMLPIGIALAILVILRLVLFVSGWPADPLDGLWVLINGPLALYFIWAGREYRRRGTPN
jgi:hypothetical protein